MAHLLFVSHDAGGTVPPVLALAAAAVRDGHAATVLSQPSVGDRAIAVGAAFVPFPALGDYDRFVGFEAQLELVGRALIADLLTPTLSSLSPPPDVLVVDANLGGSLAAAERAGVATAVLLHSMYATFTDVWFAELWPLVSGGLNDTRASLGLGAADSWASVFAPHARLLSVVPSMFDAPVASVPASMRHFGFLVPRATALADPFPAGDGPCVLVATSTTQEGQGPQLDAIIEAISMLRVRALVTTGGYSSLTSSRVPRNVRLVEFLPHPAVLRSADVMVTHAGLGSVAAALSFGVPLVCTPIDRDQPLNASRVVSLGAGVLAGEDVSASVLHVLGDDGFRAAARAIADASATEGGAAAAVIDLVSLVP